MKTETYRGVRLKVTKAGAGAFHHFVNGTQWGTFRAASEEAALHGMHGYVDSAIERPSAFASYWQPIAPTTPERSGTGAEQ